MANVYQIISERIINRLKQAEEKGERFYWVKPFAHNFPPYACCFESGIPYKGINRLLLENDEYTTFTKIKNQNEKNPKNPLYIRKGAKSHIAIYFNFEDEKDENGNIKLDEKGNPIKKPFIRYYTLFSRQDVINEKGENIPSRFPMSNYDHEQLQEQTKEELLKFTSMVNRYCNAKGITLEIITDGTQAYYNPNDNIIRVPTLSGFDSLYEYCSTVAHELTHSTGKELKRLGGFSKESYSKEELVAEIGAEMLISSFKIPDDRTNKNNDIAYLQSWVKYIKDNNKAIITAAQQAEKAADLISGYIEKEPTLDDLILNASLIKSPLVLSGKTELELDL